MKNNNQNLSRRKFVGTSATFVASATLFGPSLFGASAPLQSNKKPNSLMKGVQIGVITYSYRSLQDQSVEATLKYVLESGISAIELMGDPAESYAGKPQNPVDRGAFFKLRRAKQNGESLSDDQQKELEEMQKQMEANSKEVVKWRSTVSMDKFVELRKMYNDAGVTIFAFKPSAFGKNNTDAEMDWGMRAAKALGASHVTLEHPDDDAMTQKLGDLGEKHGIYVAYHGHEQQTPSFWDTALKQSKYNGINLDLGHYVAAGNADSLEFIKSKYDRILSMHIKDRQTPDNGKANLPWGKGDTPIAKALQVMRDNKYKFPAVVELEYTIPDGSDPIKEVKKCLAYCKIQLQ